MIHTANLTAHRNARPNVIVSVGFVTLCWLGGTAAAADKPLTVLANAMSASQGISIEKGEATVAAEGPQSSRVTRFDADFAGRIDLKPLSIDPLKFDLIKVDVKADRAAFLRFSLENFPEPG